VIKRCSGLILLACLMTAPAVADDGQGPAEPGARIEGVNLGEYWYGAKVTKQDLVGKVVLFEIYGS
jgi:hypothetical protein